MVVVDIWTCLFDGQLQMNRLEQLCIQYLESCIGVRNVLVALQNAAKLGLDFVRVSISRL